MAVCSEIHTRHIPRKYSVWAERRLFERKNGGTYSDHMALRG
jgi:hypothetical protein